MFMILVYRRKISTNFKRWPCILHIKMVLISKFHNCHNAAFYDLLELQLKTISPNRVRTRWYWMNENSTRGDTESNGRRNSVFLFVLVRNRRVIPTYCKRNTFSAKFFTKKRTMTVFFSKLKFIICFILLHSGPRTQILLILFLLP